MNIKTHPTPKKESGHLRSLRWGVALCCLASVAITPALAQSWKRIGTVTTMTNNQLCRTDGTNIICDVNTPTLSGTNIAIGTTAVTSGVALDLGSNVTSLLLPNGTTGQRPSGVNGMVRYNSTTPGLEAYVNGSWMSLLSSGGASTLTFGSSTAATNPSRSGDATTGLYSDAAGTVEIASAGTKTFSSNATYTIVPVGNVGIGSSSPTKTLDVVGTGRISTSLVTPLIYPATDSTSAIQFDKADGVSNVMTIDTINSRVGIGTTTANNTLEVGGGLLGALTGTKVTVSNATANSGVEVGQGTAARGRMLWFYNATAANAYMTLGVSGGANPLDLQDGGGKIGIGSTSPRASLDLSQQTDAISLPAGTTGQEPTGVNGMIRYNSTTPAVEAYVNNVWTSLVTAATAGVTSFSGGTTGFTPITATTGVVTLAGTLNVANGGTGDTTLTAHGLLVGEGTSAVAITAAGATATVLIGNGTSDPTFSASPTVTGLTLSGLNAIGVVTTNGSGVLATNTSLPAAEFPALTGDVTTVAGALATTVAKIQGTIVSGTTGTTNVVFSASPTLTGTVSTANITVSGTESLTLGTDYMTTGSQADVALGSFSTVRYNGSGTATFYGIVAGANGQVLYLHNASSSTLTLSNQNTVSESTVANRIITGTGIDLPVPTNTSVTMQYDGTSNRWRVTGSSNSASTLAAGTTGQVQFNGGANLAASANFFWDNTNFRLGIGSSIPTVSLDLSQKTDAVALPVGTTGQRPAGANGMVRYNSTTPGLEGYVNGAWTALLTSTGSSSLTLGTALTALNPAKSGDSTTGLYSAGAGLVDVAASGKQVEEWSTTGVNITTGGLNIAGVNGISWPKDFTADASIAIGSGALAYQPIGTAITGNTAVGYQSMASASMTAAATNNAALGAYTLYYDTTGNANTAMGYAALQYNTTGNANTALGYETYYYATTGTYNTALGAGAMYGTYGNGLTGSSNTGIGAGAVKSIAGSSAGNTVIGAFALDNMTIGSSNSVFGAGALNAATGGSYNTAMGGNAMASSAGNPLTGSNNVAVGYYALYAIQGASATNIALGTKAGYALTVGTSNLMLGNQVASTTLSTGQNNILIGTSSAVDTPATSTSNFLNIGNTIFATGMTGTLTAPVGSVGIGSVSPMAALDVVGAGKFSTAVITPLIYPQTDSTTAIQFDKANGSTNVMTIDTTNSRIGIGSNIPIASFDLSQKTDAASLPAGTTGQRPTGVNGMMRYNNSLASLEGYVNGAWTALLTTSGSSSLTLGTSLTALNPAKSGDSTTGLYSDAAGTVEIASAGTKTFSSNSTYTVLPVGSVGIGSASPGGTLDVIGGGNVNGVRIIGATTGNPSTINAVGSDASIGLNLGAKGTTGNIGLSAGGALQATIVANSTTVNYFDIGGGASGGNPYMTTAGADTNVGLTFSTKGTGSISMNPGGVGNTFNILPTTWTAPVNYIAIQGNGSTFNPTLYTFGSDTNVGLNLTPQGSGAVAITNGNITVNSGAITVGSTIVTAGVALDLGNNKTTANSSLLLPLGTTGTRPTTGVNGMIRYNSTTPAVEAYVSNTWTSLLTSSSLGSGVTLGTSLTVLNPTKSGDTTTGLYSDAAGTVEISSAGTQTLSSNATSTLVPVGSVGIGTATLGSKLSVYGNAAIGSYAGTAAPTNGLIVSGNIGIGSTTPRASLDLSQKTDALALPAGTTGQEPTGVNGMIRYNSTTPAVEAYVSNVWTSLLNSSSLGSGITLGTTTAKTNPQRSGDASTGFYSSTTAKVDVAISGIQAVDFSGTGINITIASAGLNIAGNNGISFPTADSQNGSIAVGKGAMPGLTTTAYYINTAIGFQALGSSALTSAAVSNTAVGGFALQGDTSGDNNTALGYNALLSNTTATGNTAVGSYALKGLTVPGNQNTVMGYFSMYNTSNSFGNVAIGAVSMENSTSGSPTVAIGYAAAQNMTTGSNNTYVGSYSGQGATTGSNNIAFGDSTLKVATTASQNTVVGTNVGKVLTTGSSNLALGYNVASTTLTTGQNNILIGTTSAVDTPASSTSNSLNIANVIYGTSIGTQGQGLVGIGTSIPGYPFQVGTTTSNGNGAYLSVAGVWTNASDRRIKENVQPLTYGLDTIGKLKPVSYDMIGTHEKQIGFIAQDVLTVVPEVVGVPKNPAVEHYGLSYGNMVAVVVKAMQELKGLFDADHAEIEALKAANDNQAKQIEELRAMMLKQQQELDARKAK